MRRVIIIVLFVAGLTYSTWGQVNLITNIQNRKTISLNGKWQYLVDPYETGFYDYRYHELAENNPDAYWNSDKPVNKSDKKEHGYTKKNSIDVPGDWNHQKPEFLYYEGTIWYKRSFAYKTYSAGKRVYLYFGAVNYRADVYLNGKKLGMHKGGFTPFDFEVPANLLRQTGTNLVVKVDNKRYADEVPTLNTDWWNYGGITRDVKLVEVPDSFIKDFMIQLKQPQNGATTTPEVDGWIKLDHKPPVAESIEIQIPELNYRGKFNANDTVTHVSFKIPGVKFWSPTLPKLYKVVVSTGMDKTTDKIGFRTIEADGKRLLLNGKLIFLRGICVHGEIPQERR